MPDGSADKASGLTLSEYLRVLWRWKWMIIVVVCAAAIAAAVYSSLQQPQYMATASIMYQESVDPSDPLASSDSTDARDLAVENVVNVIGSPAIANRAQGALQDIDVEDYEVSTEVRGGASEGTGGVVDVSASGADARDAARVANAYAEAIVVWSREQQLERIEVAERAVKASLEEYTTEESRLTTDYIMLRQELRNLQLLGMTVSGEFELIDQARPPDEPFEPKPLQSAMLGTGVGLLAGIGLAFLFNQLTTRVRGKHEIAEVLGLTVIGTVPEIERRTLQRGGLITVTNPDGRAAESLRLLRSNLDYLNVDGASSLLVTSGLAGEGKSMTACNLAVTMAMSGRSVVVADGDLRRPRVHEYFGLENNLGLSNVAAGDVELADALVQYDIPSAPRAVAGGSVRAPGDQGSRGTTKVTVSGAPKNPGRGDGRPAQSDRQVAVLTAGSAVSHPGELVASRRFGEIIRELHDLGMEFVIIDAPPLLEVGDAAAMASMVDALVVVVDIKKARQESLLETRHLLAPLPCKKLGAILLRTKPESRYGYYY